MNKYEAAMQEFRAVSSAHRQAVADYYARKIDDAAFLASRAKLEAAGKKVDAAEAELLAQGE